MLQNNNNIESTTRAWYGMELYMEWNGTEILVRNMEDARMEYKISRMKWKTIFHTNFILDFVHSIYR